MSELQEEREIVSCFMYHIDQPCGLPDSYHNLISLYIREAKNILPTIKNSSLKRILENRLIELS